MPGRDRADRGRDRARARALALAWGWTLGRGLVFGLALSVASTVVLLRALEERGAARHGRRPDRGRLADRRGPRRWCSCWCCCRRSPARSAAPRGGRRGGGIAGCDRPGVTLRARSRRSSRSCCVVGRRACALAARQVARAPARASCSRCAVLAVALGIAYGSAARCSACRSRSARSSPAWCSASPTSATGRGGRAAAAGRVRGAVLRLGRHAVRPGDPGARAAGRSLAVVLLIMVGKSLAAFAHRARCFGYPLRTALTIAASLAQIGEFSFILAALGVALGLLPPEGQRPDPRRRAALDHAQPARLRGRRPARPLVEARPRVLAALERGTADRGGRHGGLALGACDPGRLRPRGRRHRRCARPVGGGLCRDRAEP